MAQSFILITGIRQIDKKLKLLAPKVQKKVVRQAVRKALKLVQQEVKSQIPVDTGLARKNVKVRALKKKRRNVISIDVRVAGAEGLVVTPQSGKSAFYPAVVEYGSSQRPPNPFMRRSFEAKGAAARALAMQEILDGILREAKS